MKPFLPKFVHGAFESFTPEAFREFVKNLRIKTNTESKAVASVGIVFRPNRTTVRVKRDPKIVSREEIDLLAAEYGKTSQEIINILIQRKVGVSYEPSDSRQSTELAGAAEAKRNAKPHKNRKRKTESTHQFFEPRCDSQLHEEGPISAPDGAKE